MKIQTFPQGLIDLLNIKQSAGRTLDTMLSDVRATMDLTDVYAARRIRHEGASDATWASIGDTVVLSVPANEIWFLYGLKGQIDADDTGDVLRVSCSVVREGGEIILGLSDKLTTGAANENVFAFASFQGRPWVLTAGDEVRATCRFVTFATGAATTGRIEARVARIGPATEQAVT